MDTDYILGLSVVIFIIGIAIIGIGYLVYNAWKYNNNRNDVEYYII